MSTILVLVSLGFGVFPVAGGKRTMATHGGRGLKKEGSVSQGFFLLLAVIIETVL